jgi:inositol polyphosphate-4-phosphatase
VYNAAIYISWRKCVCLLQLTRNLKGGRMTTCKSGKDCTSMGVTLEECVLLRTEHKVNDSNFLKVLSCLRSTGTQLDNCLKNTGQRCYSFNSAQFQMLPRILRPPQHSCKHISLKS